MANSFEVSKDSICEDADLNNDVSMETHESSEEEQGLDIEEFGRLFNRIGLDDTTLINKVFWIFDEDGSGDVDHKELAIGLEMLSQSTY